MLTEQTFEAMAAETEAVRPAALKTALNLKPSDATPNARPYLIARLEAESLPANPQPERKSLRRSGLPPVDGGNVSDGGDPADPACFRVQANLSAHLDGELDTDDDNFIQAHLPHCSDCTTVYQAMQDADTLLEREWRDNAPLPSSLEMQKRLDAIIDALPPAARPEPDFAPRRVHARARWMRFAAGTALSAALLSLLGSSYSLGYRHGQRSASNNALPSLFVSAFVPSSAPPASPPPPARKVRPRQ